MVSSDVPPVLTIPIVDVKVALLFVNKTLKVVHEKDPVNNKIIIIK